MGEAKEAEMVAGLLVLEWSLGSSDGVANWLRGLLRNYYRVMRGLGKGGLTAESISWHTCVCVYACTYECVYYIHMYI